MALLEIVHRKLVKTGAISKLIRLLPRISLMLTIFSIVFIFQLPMDGQYRHTYISENALMPSQAQSFFRESEWNFVRGYRNEVIEMMNLPLVERNSVLNDILVTVGYKTGILNYTDPETGVEKPTLYAIYHVPKGDDTEAMVLTAPWFNGDGDLNVGAVALGLGLARYLRRLSIWAKNIIIVFPEDGGSVLRNWVDSYHTSLDNTGGSIETAIIIDYPSSSDYFGYIEVDYTGVNGQLPNLDLVNTAIMVADNEGLKLSVNGTPYGQLWANDYFSRLYTLVNGILQIASAGIVGCRDAQSFSGWNIQSITLRARGETNYDITSFGRVIENVFRSVNNLLEKFHQSFFFYLLLSPKLFVSVGMYLPAGGLAAGSFVVASINALMGGADASGNLSRKLKNGVSFETIPLASACLTLIITVFLSVFFSLYTSNIYNKGIQFDYKTITYDLFVIPLFLISIAPLSTYLGKFSPIKNFQFKVNSDYLRALSLMGLFYMGYALVGLMVLNFPLSFVIAICASPLCFIRYSNKPTIKRQLMNSFLLIMSCPALWLVVFGIFKKIGFELDRVRNLIQYFEYSLLQKEIQHVLDFIEVTNINVFIDGPVELFTGLVTAYTKVQCWTWIFICFSWLPVWLCMALVGSMSVNEFNDIDVDSKKKNQ